MGTSFVRLSVLGITQGLTEFLPVSSSGHLALLGNFFGGWDALLPVTVALHAATLAAVVFFWRRDIVEAVSIPRAWIVVAAVSLPTAVIGFALKGVVENIFAGRVGWVYVFMAVTAAIVLASSRALSHKAVSPDSGGFEGGGLWRGVSLMSAAAVGAAQGLAVLPGISRSGATIAAALFLGMSGKSAARFSFISSIPAVAGAAFLEFKDIFSGSSVAAVSGIDVPALAVSMALAFASGLFAIKFLVRSLETRRYGWFAGYLAVVAAAGFLWGR